MNIPDQHTHDPTELESYVAINVINKCGGMSKVARLTDRDISRVLRWTYPKSKGGTGGHIPRDPMRKLVALMRAGQLKKLTINDFHDPAPQYTEEREPA